MKLVICPECGEFIDLDKIEILDECDIVGCGQAENNFVSCHECGKKYGSDDCKSLRDEGGWTPTATKDYKK